MKRRIIQARGFSKEIDRLLHNRNLLAEDFEEFKKHLAENPKDGDLVPGTAGIRKTRLKSASKGKSGGFRICYYYYQEYEDLYLIMIYQKNKQENITAAEKKVLKELVLAIKEK